MVINKQAINNSRGNAKNYIPRQKSYMKLPYKPTVSNLKFPIISKIKPIKFPSKNDLLSMEQSQSAEKFTVTRSVVINPVTKLKTSRKPKKNPLIRQSNEQPLELIKECNAFEEVSGTYKKELVSNKIREIYLQNKKR